MAVSLTAKLQLKEGQGVAVLNPPPGFELDASPGEDAVLLFVGSRGELERLGGDQGTPRAAGPAGEHRRGLVGAALPPSVVDARTGEPLILSGIVCGPPVGPGFAQ